MNTALSSNIFERQSRTIVKYGALVTTSSEYPHRPIGMNPELSEYAQASDTLPGY